MGHVPESQKDRPHRKESAPKQTRLRGPLHRLHTDESTHSKGKQNSCLGVNRDRLHTGEHCKTYPPQGQKTTTPPEVEHPPEKQKMKARTPKDERPSSHKIFKQN